MSPGSNNWAWARLGGAGAKCTRITPGQHQDTPGHARQAPWTPHELTDPFKWNCGWNESNSLNQIGIISDQEEKLCNAFDVIKEKSLYGRKYMGIDRSTFLINQKLKILHLWRNVKVKGHVDEVIKTIKEIG